VKGVEYLIVIAFCFAFIALWILVHSKERAALSKVVSIVLPLSLVFGSGAVVLSASDTPDNVSVNMSDVIVPVQTVGAESVIAASDNGWMKVNESEYLFIKYGQDTEFHSIMSAKVSCTTCHHNSGDEIHACRDCHYSPTNPHDSTQPGLKAAYHQLCISCHKEKFNGPESCINCHTGEVKENAIIAAPNRPHELTWDTCIRCHMAGIPNGGAQTKIVYHDSCINCHSKGIAGAALEPADHAGRAANTCQGCHKPAGV
jgi:hypothetical protein